MFCKNCGKEINDNAAICPHCGVQVQPLKQTNGETNTIAVVGFVFSFLFALVGLICSIAGYKKAVKEGAPHKGLALAGIIISAASMIIALILYVTVFASVFAALATV